MLDAGRIGDVGGNVNRLAAGVTHHPHGLFAAGAGNVRDCDFGRLAREQDRRRAPDSRSGAGDERHLILESVHGYLRKISMSSVRIKTSLLRSMKLGSSARTALTSGVSTLRRTSSRLSNQASATPSHSGALRLPYSSGIG